MQLQREVNLVLASWDLFVDGKLYTVSVERMPNGKDSIRVNGRIAAQPMGSEEQEREVSVGGTPHIVRRADADGFQIAVDERIPKRAEARRRTLATGNAVLEDEQFKVRVPERQEISWEQ
jgi:hypothetical protein